MPRAVTLPAGDLEGRLFYQTTTDLTFYDSGDSSIDDATLANGFPEVPGFNPTNSSVLTQLDHKGHPKIPTNGWIPYSTEKHWHWADIVGYDPAYSIGAFGPSGLTSTNIQDAIDELANYREYLTAGNGISGDSYNGSLAKTWNINYGGSGGNYGSATTVARSDHSHGYGEYLTAGNGITGNAYNGSAAQTWNINYGGSGGNYGSATTVARSDHSHGNSYNAGGSTFAGLSSERIIAHGLGTTPSFVAAIPTTGGGAAGYVGEIWVRYNATNIYVGNTGSSTSTFTWIAMQ